MKLIKCNRPTASKIEQLELVIKLYTILNNISLSDSEITILTYFTLYGVTQQTKDLIFKAGLISSQNTLKNIISKLKKLEFLTKDKISRKYHTSHQILEIPTGAIGLIIKLG